MKPTAPDWAAVIRDIVDSGLTELEISKQPGVALSLKAVRYLTTGVQPLFHRGEHLVQLWCQRTGKARDEIPHAPVLRGHRMKRAAADLSPKMANVSLLTQATRPPVQRAPTPAPRKAPMKLAKPKAATIPVKGKAKVAA